MNLEEFVRRGQAAQAAADQVIDAAKPKPLPLLLVFRAKTGCRQYPFSNLITFEEWTARHPYRLEMIRVQVIGPDRQLAADSGFIRAAEARQFIRHGAAWSAIEARLDAEVRALYREDRDG